MKQTIYINKKEVVQDKPSIMFLEVILNLMVYALILLMASSIFNGFYVENIWYALLASLVISILNATIKPVFIWLTLPITISSLGVLYPIVNILVLKVASLFLGTHFIVEGWFVPFFIAIFISIMKILLDNIIIKPITERR